MELSWKLARITSPIRIDGMVIIRHSIEWTVNTCSLQCAEFKLGEFILLSQIISRDSS
jgi:hypothetical protein